MCGSGELCGLIFVRPYYRTMLPLHMLPMHMGCWSLHHLGVLRPLGGRTPSAVAAGLSYEP